MRRLVLALGPVMLAGLAYPALAQDSDPATAQGDVAVTIYNNGQSLVQDARQLSVTRGRNRIEFPDVSARIRPETVTLSGAGLSIVEQNFDFDLLTPDKLMDKAVGQSVTLVRTNPGAVPARLSYLTPNLGWTADYVALFDAAKGAMDLQGWVTLTNTTGTTFTNARTLLVAGNPNGGGGGFTRLAGTMDSAGTESNDRERLGDYYLYPLPARTTIANAQQKQVSFLDVKGAPAKSTYEFTNRWLGSSNDPVSAASVLRFSTSRQGGLGDQLPAGTIRVYMRDARGDPQFIGENRIDHTPMGSAMSLRTGDAFDVKVLPTIVSRTRKGDSRWVTKMKYTLSNARPGPITVQLAQDGLWGDVRIVDESLKSERVSADRVEWQVPVPANGKADVTVTFDTRY